MKVWHDAMGIDTAQKQLMVTNIQRMCFHDGPGIRTTVFTKGCSLHCPWCSNPENIRFSEEAYEKDGINGIYGKRYTTSQLVDTILKDQAFWELNGGVTFSGGEALMQADALTEVLKRLKEAYIHTAVETALFVTTDALQQVLPYIDYFIVDVKILDVSGCRDILGGDIALYKNNVNVLHQKGKLKLFRVPCCPEYTFTEKNKSLLKGFLGQYQDVPVQIFAIHSLGEKKYKSLKRPMWKSVGMDKQLLMEYCQELRKDGIKAELIQI